MAAPEAITANATVSRQLPTPRLGHDDPGWSTAARRRPRPRLHAADVRRDV